MNLGIDFDFIPLWLIGDRLPRTSSAVLRHFVFGRPHIYNLMSGSLPFSLFDSTVNLRRISLTNDKLSVKLPVGEALLD